MRHISRRWDPERGQCASERKTHTSSWEAEGVREVGEESQAVHANLPFLPKTELGKGPAGWEGRECDGIRMATVQKVQGRLKWHHYL